VFWEPCAQKQKPQEATWKKQIPCAQKTFSKDLKTQLLGEQNMQQHLLAIKSTKQTGLVFEFFSTTPPLATNGAPQKHPLMGKRSF